MLAAVSALAETRALRNVRTVRGIAEQLPFADATFDLVVTRFSAHHWRDVATGVREAARVLQPGGRAVFIDVAGSEMPVVDTHLQAIEVLRDRSHVRDYAPAQWRALVAGAGLSIRAEHVHRLRLEFEPWVIRIGTPELHVRAIRSLQSSACEEVARALEIAADGSFTSDVISLDTVREN
jgi:SAM-dependent methyltransferase